MKMIVGGHVFFFSVLEEVYKWQKCDKQFEVSDMDIWKVYWKLKA
jgi:hypothetical protein